MVAVLDSEGPVGALDGPCLAAPACVVPPGRQEVAFPEAACDHESPEEVPSSFVDHLDEGHEVHADLEDHEDLADDDQNLELVLAVF